MRWLWFQLDELAVNRRSPVSVRGRGSLFEVDGLLHFPLACASSIPGSVRWCCPWTLIVLWPDSGSYCCWLIGRNVVRLITYGPEFVHFLQNNKIMKHIKQTCQVFCILIGHILHFVLFFLHLRNTPISCDLQMSFF